MSDIKVECGKCGAGLTVSEFTQAVTIPCSQCGADVTVPPRSRKRPANYKFRPHEALSPEVAAAAASDVIHHDPRRDLLHENVKTNQPKAVWGWILLLVIAGTFTACMALGRENPALLDLYVILRLVVLFVVFVGLAVDAFGDSYLVGFLCVLVPPYTLYYGLPRADVYILRGAFAGLPIAVFAELHFIPEKALLTKADTVVASVIDFGETNIRRAGEAPVF